jgi:hypothetical protein
MQGSYSECLDTYYPFTFLLRLPVEAYEDDDDFATRVVEGWCFDISVTLLRQGYIGQWSAVYHTRLQ